MTDGVVCAVICRIFCAAFRPTNLKFTFNTFAMSLGIYPVFHPPVSDASFDSHGEDLALEFEALDELAEEYEIPALSSFGDTREIPEDFEGGPDELDELLGPCKEWFDCSQGIAAFESLARVILQNPDAAEALETPEAVADDLMALVEVLKIAKAQGAQFRLEMS